MADQVKTAYLFWAALSAEAKAFSISETEAPVMLEI